MDYQSLMRIAHLASTQVLNYHLVLGGNGRGVLALDKESELEISEKIKMFLPLAHKSPNKKEAYVEVVCDAALVVAERYNLNKRAFYAAVQNLATVTLIPGIYEAAGDPVPLSAYHLRLYEDSDSEEGEKEEGVKPHATATKGVTPRSSGVAWTEAEFRKLIDLKVSGTPYPAIAEQLGRSVPAVQGKWSFVGKAESGWKDYINKKRTQIWSKRSDMREDSDVNEEEDEEADEEVPPPVPAADTVAATNNPAALEPRREWTDADIRELVRYKLIGLSTSEISMHMRRPGSSIGCQWMNMASNPNGKWFNYLHEEVRAKKTREEQAKALQGDSGAGGDVNGQPKWVSLSLFT